MYNDENDECKRERHYLEAERTSMAMASGYNQDDPGEDDDWDEGAGPFEADADDVKDEQPPTQRDGPLPIIRDGSLYLPQPTPVTTIEMFNESTPGTVLPESVFVSAPKTRPAGVFRKRAPKGPPKAKRKSRSKAKRSAAKKTPKKAKSAKKSKL